MYVYIYIYIYDYKGAIQRLELSEEPPAELAKLRYSILHGILHSIIVDYSIV